MSKQKTAQQLAEEALLFKSKKYYTIEQMADTIEANSNALNKILSLPRLSIPKKIAETLDLASKGLTEFEDYLWAVNELDILVPNDEAEYFRKWSNEEANAYALAISYVTGKALGVELVEVTDE